MRELKKIYDEDTYKFISDLRELKQNGTLDSKKYQDQTSKWRNIVEYHVLKKYVMSYCEECRLSTLALIVESRKSTLCFTPMELDIILLFVKYNLCEKMEYIPFIKMALNRLKDSLAVMQRKLAQEQKARKYRIQSNGYNIYDIVCETNNALALSYLKSEQIKQDIKNYITFFINLRKICVYHLNPDATYNRRRSCLQILLLMEGLHVEKFKNIGWRKKQARRIFGCLLLDTYESNKEMAYQILKSMNSPLLVLDSAEDIKVIIKIALEFGNGMRPIDSVTAAYMLKISKLIFFPPIIRNSCSEEDVPDAVTLQLVLMLYKKLQEALVLAKQNIGMVITKCSLYGYLFCMRSLLIDCDFRCIETNKLWQNTIADIILLCFELSHAVSVVVNNSSPEGHLPMDLKTLNFNDDVSLSDKKIITPQMVLLCSWRTVKEVSLLFGLFATKASIQTDECTTGLLTKEQIGSIMKHLVLLLCETKHRGAFEQAYVGFHQLCTRLWRLTNTTLNKLLIHYLHDILIGITGLMPGYSKLCATRRSAGVPFVVQAVLSSEPKKHNPKLSAFHTVMEILLEFLNFDDTTPLWQRINFILHNDTIFSEYVLTEPIVENRNESHDRKIELDVLKTHSMNILRALFRHSRLGDMVKDYVAIGLEYTFNNFNNETWAERNAATLLFGALIIRIFGVQRTKDHINLTTDNKMTARLFFDKNYVLMGFLVGRLHDFVVIDDGAIKSDIPAILLLLSRLYINKSDANTNVHVDKSGLQYNDMSDYFITMVSRCAKSPVHKTRELAARALVPLLTEKMAFNVLKKLLQVLCTIRDIGISVNLIHGYLLQILEIITKLPCVYQKTLKSQISDFLYMTNWILKGLEKGSSGCTCFLLATIYVDILHALYNIDKDIIVEYMMTNIWFILKQHLIQKDLLMSGPGEQMYKISVIKFMLHVEINTCYEEARMDSFNIYLQLLIAPEAEIQSIAWTTVIDVLKKVHNEQRELLYSYAIRAVANLAEDLFRCNPKLQDAIFDFLYRALMESEGDANEHFINVHKREICNLVLKKLHPHNANNIYSQRISYFRLLGKCMVTLNNELKDEKELKVEHIKDIYKEVCDNDWIGSLQKDFRSSVFDILYDLFNNNNFDAEHCHPMLDWWTMLLQLLVDDNADIRYEAYILLYRIEPQNKLECFERNLSIFFKNFKKMVADKYPDIAISALFCWSVSLLGNTDYEMDETDVFNKCRNYDVFEPVRISEMCFNLTKSIIQRYSIDSVLPPEVVSWINYRLDTDFSTLSSFRNITHRYKDSLPILSGLFKEIVDPTFKDKLLQVSACIKYMSL